MRCLVDSGDSSEHKLLLLDGSVPAGTLDGLPEGVRERVQLAGFEVLPHDVPYGYEQMPFDAVLRVRGWRAAMAACCAACCAAVATVSLRRRDVVVARSECSCRAGGRCVSSTVRAAQAVLPSGVDVPSAFETVGHIAHFNLRDEQLPWRRVVGQVCLDKNPAIRTVVHKVGEVGSEFRVFAMELLAGAPPPARVAACATALARAIFCSGRYCVPAWRARLAASPRCTSLPARAAPLSMVHVRAAVPPCPVYPIIQ